MIVKNDRVGRGEEMPQPKRGYRGKRHKKRALSRIRATLLSMGATLVLVLVVGLAWWFLWGNTVGVSSDDCVLTEQEDGSMVLSWKEVNGAESYIVKVSWKDADGKNTYEATVETNSCKIPITSDIGSCTIHVQTGGNLTRTIVDVSTNLSLGLSGASWHLNEETGVLNAMYSLSGGATCSVCLMEDGNVAEEVMTVKGESVEISFGDDGDLPLPDSTYTIGLCASRVGKEFSYIGYATTTYTVSRSQLLGKDMEVAVEDEDGNVYTFTWNETAGSRYVVQQYDEESGSWLNVAYVATDAERTYTTPHLDSFTTYTYRIVAEDSEAAESESNYIAISEEIVCETEASAIYCTVWPMLSLTAYSDSEKTQRVGTVSAMKAYCVLDEADGMFGVLVDGETWYIDSSTCMINLTEYLGDLCTYDITNSYDSVFTVHEFEFPGVSGEVVTGFENMALNDGTFVTPLMYSVADKLMDAALMALDAGYRLRIYESYRPAVATTTLYSMGTSLLSQTIPTETWTGKSLSELEMPSNAVTTETIVNEDGTITLKETVASLTYADVMYGGSSYHLSNFLAAKRSRHNVGVAVDLTLEDAETGEELVMQTVMHDLSQYSVTDRNTTNANILASIMTSAGLSPLVSEWWHFQDDEVDRVDSMSSVPVSIEGWKQDVYGRRYRLADGSYYTDCTVTISGTEYDFNSDGYLIE
ncbi:MAG: hypothetical protein LIO67_06065 [Lachnospiraceae bacterium]|nr:hypothetical protein [Lachnospiraceae bacterium]